MTTIMNIYQTNLLQSKRRYKKRLHTEKDSNDIKSNYALVIKGGK